MSGAALVVGGRGGYPPGKAGGGKNAGLKGSSLNYFSRQWKFWRWRFSYTESTLSVRWAGQLALGPLAVEELVEARSAGVLLFITSIGFTRFRLLEVFVSEGFLLLRRVHHLWVAGTHFSKPAE